MAVLAVLILAGQLVGAFDGEARPWIVGVSILVLDAVGAAASWRAAKSSLTGPLPWGLIGAGRAASVLATIALFAADSGATTIWWWVGAVARLVMFALISAGMVAGGLRQFSGRHRIALIAEILVVLCAGFMVTWYFDLEPTLVAQDPSRLWLISVGWPLGDLLLLAAVASVVLRGAVTRFAAPITAFSMGLAVLFAADVTWSIIDARGTAAAVSPAAGLSIVTAGLLLTAAPIVAGARRGRPFQRRLSDPPTWATHLPMVAMVTGGLLMLIVTLREGQLLPWGGLVCALIVMTCAAAVRQTISLRESHDQVIADPLTGLANRVGLDRAFDRLARRGESATVLLIDLDGFKLVNDAYGHAAGDAFLIHVARQLDAVVRKQTTIARIGGDEFVVLLAGISSATQATAVAGRILAALSEHPADLDDDVVPVRASVGVALAESGQDSKMLLRQADIAMYHSKRAGSHGHTLYHPALIDRRAADAALADDLEHAQARGELHVLYQPLVDLNTERPIAAEALLRWQHPVHGLISPVQFIPIAERTGTINSIGMWVLEQALTQLDAFHQQNPAGPRMHISVNLSPRQLREPSIVHDILTVIARAGVDPRHLVLEVTEAVLVDEAGGIAALRALREHGIRIALDDFGTGYSSLQYLTRLPVDILKIDRSFVAELNGTAEGTAVTEAVIRLAQVLHLNTVAEGIETSNQAAELRALGCHTGQGFLYAKPLPAGEFTQLLQPS
ncbi:bifunctional diguanylate cyclase/phosphodiesterase [Actinoplanes sp. Pm04-4]|uniref:Bifunctional diguanylate cyclase/phosphodiesterase n=1 Tax=Paractinoplanes pyxinae TaxID=2997416 RepID=A0ABT4BCD0_9ACTN|nr:bifunctional diguanylate cyclase/phosphodiesterase [Actinoplanes pyxinae]MCY1144171.1 bifunctional diguanylate cyclase/phosphodiesterase [Actinoplanes pyxinae]